MSAFDAMTGAERWTACAAAETHRWIGAADDQRAYVVEQPGPLADGTLGAPVLTAIDVATGDVQWRFDLPDVAGFPPGTFVAAGVIVVGLSGENGTDVVGVDAATGTERWRLPVGRDGRLTATSGRVAIIERGLPPEERPTVITADASGRFPERPLTTRLTGYDRATGLELWTSDVSRPAPGDDAGSSMGAAADSNTVVVALPAVVALDDATGALRWTLTADLGDATVGRAQDGVVLMGGQDDETTALSIDTGSVLWTRPGSPPYDDVWAVSDGAVYLVDDGELVAYGLTDGVQRWRRPVDRDAYTWPWLAVGGSLYTMWWNLESRSTSDGAVQWTTDHPIGGEPTDQTSRMVSIARSGSALVVAYARGSGVGD